MVALSVQCGDKSENNKIVPSGETSTLLNILNMHNFNQKQCKYRGYSFERNCVLRRWESETLK